MKIGESLDEPDGTILIIDNDESVTRALCLRFENAGFACRRAYSGMQGLSMFDPEQIDLVITDLNMPTLDGYEVVREIRRSSDVPIIVITGFRKEFSQEIREMPNILLCEKPFKFSNLLELAETEVYLHHSRRAA